MVTLAGGCDGSPGVAGLVVGFHGPGVEADRRGRGADGQPGTPAVGRGRGSGEVAPAAGDREPSATMNSRPRAQRRAWCPLSARRRHRRPAAGRRIAGAPCA